MKRNFLILLLFVFFLLPQSAHAAKIMKGLSDDELLDVIQRQTFQFFVHETNRRNGLVMDRAYNKDHSPRLGSASIASVGFALTAYGVGVERGWMDYNYAFEITRRTLKYFLEGVENHHGFFYHFLNPDTGTRAMNSEVSPIDTALFLAGALFAAEYFDHQVIRDLAMQLYERVDWQWMMNRGDTLAMAWAPNRGFFRHRWDSYNESMIMYFLAIASPTYPIPVESWKAINRPVGSYGGHRVIQMPPLFTHQYSHVWVDFYNKNDGFADYFQNSVNATLAQRQFAIDQSKNFKTYSENVWGLTACDGPAGYKAYGAPPGWALHDGTVAPTACGSSIVFTPEESIACLRTLYEKHGNKLWGRYGLADAFNLDKHWYDDQVIGIDQGTLLLMIENYRSGLIWAVMETQPHIKEAMQKIGFKEGTMELPWPDPPVYEAPRLDGRLTVDGYLKDWPTMKTLDLNLGHKESGFVEDDKDVSGSIRFAWDDKNLYFAAKVQDNDLVLRKTGRNIWRDDLLEIYLDPGGDGLRWEDTRDYQLGFRPSQEGDGVETWSWFQGGDDPSESKMVRARAYTYDKGYVLEGAISWAQVGIEPKTGEQVHLSVALHDIDRDRSEGKLQWFFRNEEDFHRFSLGRVTLGPNEA